MNTVEIGDALELEILGFFKSLLSKGDFPFRAENCAIFLKKGYFSKDRGSDIVFDLAIEVYTP